MPQVLVLWLDDVLWVEIALQSKAEHSWIELSTPECLGLWHASASRSTKADVARRFIWWVMFIVFGKCTSVEFSIRSMF